MRARTRHHPASRIIKSKTLPCSEAGLSGRPTNTGPGELRSDASCFKRGCQSLLRSRASAVGLHHAAPHHAEAFPCPGPNVRSALRRPRPLLILSPAAPWAPEPPGGIHRQQREPENKKKDHVHSASCVRACLRGRVGCTGPTCQPGGKRCEQKRPRSARDWPCRARHAHTPPLSPFTRLPEAPSVAIQDISTNRRWCLEQGTNDAK